MFATQSNQPEMNKNHDNDKLNSTISLKSLFLTLFRTKGSKSVMGDAMKQEERLSFQTQHLLIYSLIPKA